MKKIKGVFEKKEFRFTKNPYYSKKIKNLINQLNKENRSQKQLEECLEEFNSSKYGKYLYDKYKTFDSNMFRNLSIYHQEDHIDRVTFLAMNIAKEEGILSNEKIADIMITAAKYHDIGKTFDEDIFGKHAIKGAEIIEKGKVKGKEINLTHLSGELYTQEEINMLKAIIASHDGRDEEIDEKIKYYGVSEENFDIVKKLAIVLKDADALDRCRLDFFKNDLNPDFLRLDTSKQMIELAYQLENLTGQVKNMNNILQYGIHKDGKQKYKEKEQEEEIEQSEPIYTFSNIIDKVRDNNYNIYNQNSGQIDSKNAFMTILNNYLQNVILEKIDITEIGSKAKELAIHMVEHLTGDYEIGIGDVDFEELTENAETITNIIAYSDENKLSELLVEGNTEKLAVGIVDGTVASGLIPSNYEEKANISFKASPEKIKLFFQESMHNITHLNEKVTNFIAHITKMDTEESKELNTNIGGKLIGGIIYDLFSGTLVKKRHFTPVINSQSMLEKIEQEGILHFSSAKGVSKIMETGKIKTSNFLESDLTSKKSFFFAGVPTFEDLLINIPAYDVMQAVRIKPTQKQMEELKYRALNDRAVVKDGEFLFDENQAEVVYYGLMYDKEKNGIYLGELTEEEAKDFKVSQEVRQAYHYEGKKSTLQEKIKMNAYGVYAEYKHHQKLLQMEETLRQRGINSFRDVNDKTLVELADIEQAYISTKDKSVERRNLFTSIKAGLMKNKDRTKEEREDDRIV